MRGFGLLAGGMLVTPPFSAIACDLQQYCVKFVGCFEDKSLVFQGQALGMDGGPLAAETSIGTICQGEWYRTRLRMGAAGFSCSDGLSGKVVYFYQDPDTGTASGRGMTDDGGEMLFWSGPNVEQYLDSTGQLVKGVFRCGGTEMLLG